MLLIPGLALLFIFYFQYIDLLFKGKKKIFRIDEKSKISPSRQEVLYTTINLIIFALIGLFLAYSNSLQWTKVYYSQPVSFWEYLYLLISFLIALAIHDSYFYLSHRFLHTKYMFKYIHQWHHRSHPANSWSAFSFHPIEGIIQIGVVLLVAFVLSIHEYVLFLFTFFLLFISVYGHSGYELRPNKWKGFNIFNTSLHHFQHHQFVRYNFGIYLNVWDKLFNSDYPAYEEAFNKLSKEIRLKKKQFRHPNSDR